MGHQITAAADLALFAARVAPVSERYLSLLDFPILVAAEPSPMLGERLAELPKPVLVATRDNVVRFGTIPGKHVLFPVYEFAKRANDRLLDSECRSRGLSDSSSAYCFAESGAGALVSMSAVSGWLRDYLTFASVRFFGLHSPEDWVRQHVVAARERKADVAVLVVPPVPVTVQTR